MEIKESGIKSFQTFEDMQKVLNGHFKTVSVEKHPHAMVKFIVKKVFDVVFKNFHGEKVSKSREEIYIAGIIKEFRRFYGEWVNIYDFNIKKESFKTNFEAIFKTEFGRLYGNFPGSIHDHVFYTAHCFDQYQERSDCYKTFPLLVLAYRRIRSTYPTPADILRFMVLNADQYCWKGNFIYVNVRNGVVVFEKLSGGILIAKTFLLPDMDYPRIGWYDTVGYGLLLNSTDLAIELCKEFEKTPAYISFPNEDLDYKVYVDFMKEQQKSSGLTI